MKTLGLIALLMIQSAGPLTDPIVVGHFAVDGGLPLPPAIGSLVLGLQFQSADGRLPSHNSRMGADGTVVATLPTGDYNVTLGNPPFGYTVKSITYGTVDLKKGQLTVVRSASSTIEIVLEVLPGVHVNGRVSNLPADYSRLFPEGRMVILGYEGRQMFQTKLNPDGSFEFPRVPPHDYVIFLPGGRSTRMTVGIQNVTGVVLDWVP